MRCITCRTETTTTFRDTLPASAYWPMRAFRIDSAMFSRFAFARLCEPSLFLATCAAENEPAEHGRRARGQREGVRPRACTAVSAASW